MIPSFPMTTAERMAAFCKRYEVEPCKLRYSRRATDSIVMTDELLEWHITNGARLDWISPDRPHHPACFLGYQGAVKPMATRRNVKSDAEPTADAHERGRDYLGLAQLDRLLTAAKAGGHGARDHLLILMMFRHGLRVSEAISLRRDHVDLAQSRLRVPRLKRGLSVEHFEASELIVFQAFLPQTSGIFDSNRSFSLSWSKFHQVSQFRGRQ